MLYLDEPKKPNVSAPIPVKYAPCSNASLYKFKDGSTLKSIKISRSVKIPVSTKNEKVVIAKAFIFLRYFVFFLFKAFSKMSETCKETIVASSIKQFKQIDKQYEQKLIRIRQRRERHLKQGRCLMDVNVETAFDVNQLVQWKEDQYELVLNEKEENKSN